MSRLRALYFFETWGQHDGVRVSDISAEFVKPSETPKENGPSVWEIHF